MVFPSVPVYMDPPNWNHQQQQQARQQDVRSAGDAPQTQLLQTSPPAPPLSPPPAMAAATAGATMRPTSMAERARLAKIPQPEMALKCPRCNSTNTKFCYFNNYSLTQPRHFCKACRRYWTRGGALRSVPVGGGCRRNKRNKSSSSSSTSAAAGNSSAKSSAADSAGPSSSSTFSTTRNSSLPQLSFMASSQYSLQDYGASNLIVNFSGIQQTGVDYQSSLGLDQQWRLHQIQQFPFFGGLDPPPPPPQTTSTTPPPGLFPFDVQAKPSASGLITQLASVKMDDNNINTNINNPHHQFLGLARNSDQFWGNSSSSGANVGGVTAGGWTGDHTGFNSTSSSGHLL